jgi:hypothetical protein
MNETPRTENIPGDIFDKLKNDLCSGQITPEDFLDTVMELDQSDPRRISAIRAVEILSNPEVESFFINTDESENFYNTRSISYVHKAQIRLSEGDTNVEDDLQNALSDSVKTDLEDWSNYIKATIAYLANDLEALKALVDTIIDNNALVRNFITGLEDRGHPDYLADCSKSRI